MANWNPATAPGKVRRDRFGLDWSQPCWGHWPHIRTSLPGIVAGVAYVTIIGGTIDAQQRLGWAVGQVVPLEELEAWAQVTYQSEEQPR